MKNIQDVLSNKEQQYQQAQQRLQQLHRDLEVLKAASKLLAEEPEAPQPQSGRAANVNGSGPQMIMRPPQPTTDSKSAAYTAPSAWDANKPQFP